MMSPMDCGPSLRSVRATSRTRWFSFTTCSALRYTPAESASRNSGSRLGAISRREGISRRSTAASLSEKRSVEISLARSTPVSMTRITSPWSRKPSFIWSLSSERLSKRIAWSSSAMRVGMWSARPVTRPTTDFSAFWHTRANPRVSRESCQASFSATATAVSSAADEPRPTPTGTSESTKISRPGTAERSAPT